MIRKSVDVIRAAAAEQNGFADQVIDPPKIKARFLENAADLAHAAVRMEELEELLRSACAIAERRGADTAWERFKESAAKLGLNGVTARTYRLLPDDPRDLN